MLANNNQQVITRMARHSFQSNRRRSLIMVLAVVLSSFMLFSVLTVGVTYFKMKQLQDIRLNGADFDAIMYGLTEEQQEYCENNPDIERTGIAAMTGYVVETEKDSTPNVGLVWSDDTYHNIMRKQAIEKMEGNYPTEPDEILVTKEALEACGLERLGIGDSFTMKYTVLSGTYTKEFRICGMWEGYGDKKVFYMSESFYQTSGYQLSDVSSGRYFIQFKDKYISQKKQDAFIDSMNLSKQQNLFFTSETSYSVPILLGLVGLILITCLCAYLLIYNIMYLSVSGNIRYYGLLQTVGMTGKQVHRLMLKQMFLTGSIGTAGGLLLGSGVSFFLIPIVVRTLGIRSKTAGPVEVGFQPAIFLLTILLTGITVYAGSRKPAAMAVAVSPIEALGYRVSSSKKNARKSGSGRLIWRMAREQITKDKKKTGVVMLSLAAALSVFLCLVTMLESHGARTLMSNYMNMDMVIKNDTMKKEDRKDWIQILDQTFLDEIRGNDAVKEVHPMLSAEITVPWEPEFADMWMQEFYDMWMSLPYADDLEEYKEHPENFGSFMVGISEAEFEYLNEAMEDPVDKEAFLKGDICILYRNHLDFTMDDLSGMHITCAEYADAANTKTFEIAGLTNENYYTSALLGMTPTIIVSDSVVKSFVAEPLVYKAAVKYNKEYDESAEADMLRLMQASSHAKDFSHDSKIEEMENVKKAQGNMMEIGIGIVLILAFIGIMNYMNTVIGNIQNRQVELAILESVGMTEKQMDRMLVIEGLLFAGGSVLLTATVGLGITYWLYESMNYQRVGFAIPVLPVAGMLIFILLVCVTIPLVTRRILAKKGSIIERIRGMEI